MYVQVDIDQSVIVQSKPVEYRLLERPLARYLDADLRFRRLVGLVPVQKLEGMHLGGY